MYANHNHPVSWNHIKIVNILTPGIYFRIMMFGYISHILSNADGSRAVIAVFLLNQILEL